MTAEKRITERTSNLSFKRISANCSKKRKFGWYGCIEELEYFFSILLISSLEFLETTLLRERDKFV